MEAAVVSTAPANSCTVISMASGVFISASGVLIASLQSESPKATPPQTELCPFPMARRNESYRKEMAGLKRCTVELGRDMNPDDMKAVLYAKGVLTTDEMDRLELPTMTTKDKNIFILLKIPSKGLDAFGIFIDALQATSKENPVHQELIDLLLAAVNNS